MPSARNTTPGPSNLPQLTLRSRNVTRTSNPDQDQVETGKRKAESESEGRERKRRKRKKRKLSVVSPPPVSRVPRSIGKRPFESSDEYATSDLTSKPPKATERQDTNRVVAKPDSHSKPGPSSSESSTEVIARLTKQLDAQTKLVKKHEDLLAQVRPSVVCQICLDVMFKPFALAPCGHVACYDCLVTWFSTDNNNEPAGAIQFRKKTCPHCRAVIRNAPVAVWGMKSIAISIAKSGILPGFESNIPPPETLTTGESTPKDLWGRIFRPMPGHADGGEDVGFYDAEDGGVYRCLECMHEIWGDTCTNCGRVYHGHHEEELLEEDEPPQPGGGFYNVQWLLNAVRAPTRRIFGSAYEEEPVEEEEYEESFIDDEDDHGWPVVPTRQSSEDPESRLEYHYDIRQSSPISEVSTEEDEGPTNDRMPRRNPPRGRQIGESSTSDRLRPLAVASPGLPHRGEVHSSSAYDSDEDYIGMAPSSHHPWVRFNDSDAEQSTDEAEPNEVGGTGSDDDEVSDRVFRRSTHLRGRRRIAHEDDSE